MFNNITTHKLFHLQDSILYSYTDDGLLQWKLRFIFFKFSNKAQWRCIYSLPTASKSYGSRGHQENYLWSNSSRDGRFMEFRSCVEMEPTGTRINAWRQNSNTPERGSGSRFLNIDGMEMLMIFRNAAIQNKLPKPNLKAIKVIKKNILKSSYSIAKKVS